MNHILSIALLIAAFASPALAQDCGDWSREVTPNPGSVSNLLIDVAAASASEAIAVGHWADPVLARRPMVVRWNGTDWSSIALPDTSGLGSTPNVEGVGRTPGGDISSSGMASLARARANIGSTCTTPARPSSHRACPCRTA